MKNFVTVLTVSFLVSLASAEASTKHAKLCSDLADKIENGLNGVEYYRKKLAELPLGDEWDKYTEHMDSTRTIASEHATIYLALCK